MPAAARRFRHRRARRLAGAVGERASRLDWLAVTHADLDHIGGAVGGRRRLPAARDLGRACRFRATRSAATLQASSPAARVVAAASARRSARDRRASTIEVLHPPLPDWERQRVRNDDSVVLRLRYGDVELLLTGDAGAEFERASLARGRSAAPLRVLKVAHHGSRTSSSASFVERYRPAGRAGQRRPRQPVRPSRAGSARAARGGRRRRSSGPIATARSSSRPTARALDRAVDARGGRGRCGCGGGRLTRVPGRFEFVGRRVVHAAPARPRAAASSASKRRVNLSLASRSADSGSMPSLRARLASENSRSPSSSAVRAPAFARAPRGARGLLRRSCRRRPRRAASRSRPSRRACRSCARAAAPAAHAARRPARRRSRPRRGLFARLDPFPLLEHGARRVRAPARFGRARAAARRREDVRMPADRASSMIASIDVGDVEPSGLGGDLRVKHALKQHVAELAARARRNRRGRSRRAPRRSLRAGTAAASVRLLAVPRAAVAAIAASP